LKNLLNRERVQALVTFAFGVILWAYTYVMPTSKMDPVGPTAMPRFLGIVIALVSVVQFLISKGPYEAPKKEKHFEHLAFLVVSVAIYLFLFEVIGFIIDTFVFLIVFVLYFNRAPFKEKIKGAVLFSAGFTAFLFIAFRVCLKILLPTLFITI